MAWELRSGLLVWRIPEKHGDGLPVVESLVRGLCEVLGDLADLEAQRVSWAPGYDDPDGPMGVLEPLEVVLGVGEGALSRAGVDLIVDQLGCSIRWAADYRRLLEEVRAFPEDELVAGHGITEDPRWVRLTGTAARLRRELLEETGITLEKE